MSVVKSIRRAVAKRQKQQQQRSIPRQPSERNLEIYNRVIANCEPQTKIAAEFHLTPSRISQILRNVRAYIQARSASEGISIQQPLPPPNASPSPTPDSLLPTPSASPFLLRLSTLITREEHLHTLLMREYSHHALPPTDPSSSPPPLVSPSPSPSIDLAPSVMPPLPPSPVPCPPSSSPLAVQCLKAAHRTLLELRRLYQLEHNLLNPHCSDTPTRRASEDQPASHTNTASATNTSSSNLQSEIPNLKSLSSLQDALYLLRQQAEDDGFVPKSDNLYLLVKNLLHSFLGQSPGTYGGGFHHLDDSIRQFLKTFLISPLPITPPNPEPTQLLSDLVGTAGPAAPVLPTDAPTPTPSDPPNDSPSPNLQSEIPNLHSDQTLNMSAAPSPDESALTPNPTTTSDSLPSPKPRRKKPTPHSPQPSTSFPQLGPTISLIDPAQYNALFHPWTREY